MKVLFSQVEKNGSFELAGFGAHVKPQVDTLNRQLYMEVWNPGERSVMRM